MKRFFTIIIEFLKRIFMKKENEVINVQNDNNNENNIETIEEPVFVSNGCKIVILIDNGHGDDTPGKRSPYSLKGIEPKIDFYEYKWNREIANEIHKELRNLGYDARLVVTEINDISLKERVNRVNKICNEVGVSNVILISIHSNAAGNGSEWKSAKGWCAYTSKGTTKSDKFAEYLYDEAEKNFVGRKIRTDKSDGDRDWENDFYILFRSNCTAVLTENFFYDNVDDVQYILSEEGRKMVIKTHVDGIINYIKTIKK